MTRHRTQRAALAATIAACPPLQTPEHAALVTLARTLAAQMDAAGADPSTRLSAAYLSVLKDIQRVIAAASAKTETPGTDDKRAKLRALRSRAAETRAAS